MRSLWSTKIVFFCQGLFIYKTTAFCQKTTNLGTKPSPKRLPQRRQRHFFRSLAVVAVALVWGSFWVLFGTKIAILRNENNIFGQRKNIVFVEDFGRRKTQYFYNIFGVKVTPK